MNIQDSYKLFTASNVLKCDCCTNEGFWYKHLSSNINEVARAILNSFIKTLHNYKKAQNVYKRIKIKNAPKNI